MRWPWERETRSFSYADAVANHALSRAGGSAAVGDPLAIAAVEIASGLWGRAFMAADVLPNVARLDAISPAVRALIGRQLVRRGECLFVIEVDRGKLRLDPATTWTVMGAADPASWRYEVTRAGPSRTLTTRRVAAERVVHIRYGTSPERPWVGVGPLQAASLTAALGANLERRLSEEASMAAGSILTVPDGTPKAQLQTDLRALKGQLVLVDSTSNAYGSGNLQAPRRDMEATRVGADPPDTLATLRNDAAFHVLAACGVPPEMLRQSDGTGRREAWRQFLFGSVAPVAKIVAAELADKLDVPDLTFNHDAMSASDISGRARAFQSLVKGGMDVAQAAALAGLMESDE